MFYHLLPPGSVIGTERQTDCSWRRMTLPHCLYQVQIVPERERVVRESGEREWCERVVRESVVRESGERDVHVCIYV